MKQKMDHNDSLLQFLMHFIFAGSSALILSIAYIYTDFWFIYIFALLPFLYRVINTDFKGSLACGLFLALSIGFVISTGEVISAPVSYACNLIFLCFTFIAFSIVINRLKKYVGLGFLLFAALCIPLEYFHKSYFEFNTVFASLKNDAGFVFRVSSLTGFIFVSFILIAISSLLLFLIDILYRSSFYGRFYPLDEESREYRHANDRAFLKHWKCLPCLRAPPVYL
ncbi:MAG: hypothetical protein JSW64_15820 [Candidatus Zixiibacteriota bacterium]|nr:MAG: hypothetical protein JSW64_15820 [candidate division Zixibacteria bacterium]